MDVKIHFRCDQYEYYTTDDTTMRNTTWEQVFREVNLIESRNTVLEITRVDID